MRWEHGGFEQPPAIRELLGGFDIPGTVTLVATNLATLLKNTVLMGITLNLSPLVVVMSLLLWGMLWGDGRNVPLRAHHGDPGHYPR